LFEGGVNLNIALVGKMRSGKDTLAEYAIENYDFTRFAFGDGIREICGILFPEQMKDGNKPRSLLQGVGQMMRQIDNDVWVNKCFSEIETERLMCVTAVGKDIVNPIITDLRQPNEYQRCKDEGYIIIKVHCDEDLRIKRILEKNDKFNVNDLYHETEMHIDTYDCDFVISNNGSIEELYKQFDEIIIKHAK
jgi:dephospho-CoA kinase